jgi:hypothetical protein
VSELSWNWLAAPYLACTITMIAVALLCAIVRGDRVMRLGVAGAAMTAVPWAFCTMLVGCTRDPATATRLLRLGLGPESLVGPNMLIVLLGVSGQLERYRWIARFAGGLGIVLLAVCWGTTWTVPGVHELPSGLLYASPGPLTGFHISQLGLWLVIGMLIVRRTSTGGERRRLARLLVGMLVLGAVGGVDVLLVYGVWGWYPVAWLPATVAGMVALYLVLATDLLRPQGFDRGVIVEVIGFSLAAIVIAILVFVLDGATPLAEVALASIVWVVSLGVTWAVVPQRPVRVASEAALEEFVGRLADVDDEKLIAERLTGLWKTIAVDVRALWRAEGDQLVEVASGATRPLDRELAAWLVGYEQPIAPADLATMRLGAIRPKVEALAAVRGATLIVPMIDRGALVGLVEADHGSALREGERGLVVEAARAAARALTYASLARAAAQEGATAREVEVAEAMRIQASASRDDELGRWAVAAEYRSAPRTTGAGWSATLLADGRLAVLVTEAQAHGVAAALATAALTGAFAAATSGASRFTIDELLTSLHASADGVMRGGEPIAAFLALLDGDRETVSWACAGHPGAFVVGPVAHGVEFPLGSATGPRPECVALGGDTPRLGASLAMATRGESRLPRESMLVLASTAVRGEDDARWQLSVREMAPAGSKLAQLLVDAALRRGVPHEDFLAVVVRLRG